MKLIDLCAVLVAMAFAYYFREGMVQSLFTWQLGTLCLAGLGFGVLYRLQGSSMQPSDRMTLVHMLGFAAMIIPAVIAVDGWDILLATIVFGASGLLFSCLVFFGWAVSVLVVGRPVSKG